MSKLNNSTILVSDTVLLSQSLDPSEKLEFLAMALKHTLESQIPLSRHIGISVKLSSDRSIRLNAPLFNNKNHEGIAFAGSLNAVTTLAGWGLLWVLLRELEFPGSIIIQDSTVQYLHPVVDDFWANCYPPEPSIHEKLIHGLRRGRRTRIELSGEVRHGNGAEPDVLFHGRYVIVPASFRAG